MPSLNSFIIPTGEWKLLKQLPDKVAWVNRKIPDTMTQFLSLSSPNDLPPDYPNIESHRAMFEQIAQKTGGAVVSVEFVKPNGIEAFQTIFKLRGERNKMGRLYLGTLMFPFKGFFCGIQFQCDEHGTTGLRESMVYMLESGGKKPRPETDNPPVVVKSMDEFFDLVKQAPIVRTPSDDEKYDNLVPDHPLSWTRRYLKWIIETIDFDEEVREAKPYRLSTPLD